MARHTFHSEASLLEDLHPDGRTALVRGLRDHAGVAPFRLLEVDLAGERPERVLFDEKGYDASIHPDGRRILLCRGGEVVRRKGYRGSRSARIWLYDRGNGSMTRMVDEETSARQPEWDGDGKGFRYLSERDGTFNVWHRDLASGADRQETFFQGDGVHSYGLSADGGAMVLSRGFDLWMRKNGEEPRKLEVWHTEDFLTEKGETRRVRGTDDADFSSSGLEIVFAEDGAVWAMDTVMRKPLRLTPEEVHCSHPRFSSDGNFVYYLRDDGIGVEVWRMSREAPEKFWWRSGAPRHEAVTECAKVATGFALSPCGERLACHFLPGTLRVCGIDGADGKVLMEAATTVEFDWSPCGQWLVVSAQDGDFNRDIHLVAADGGREPFNLSRHPGYESSPRWSPDGRKIAFLGKRSGDRTGLHFVHLRLEDDRRTPRNIRLNDAEAAMRRDPLYRMSENAGESSGESDKAGAGEKSSEEKDEGKKPDDGPLRIDFANLGDRIRTLDTAGAVPGNLIWSEDSRFVMFQSGSADSGKLFRVGLRRDDKAGEVTGRRGRPVRAEKGGVLYWIVNRTPAKWTGRELTTYPVSAVWLRDREAHQRMGFRMIWRTVGGRFYDPSLNGLDWKAVRKKYEDVVAGAPDSGAFQRAVEMMVGELNASHLGFAADSWPALWRAPGAELEVTRHLGLRLAAGGGGLEVAEVLPGGPAEVAEPLIGAGDRILKIDDQPVEEGTDWIRLLNGRLEDPVRILVRHADGAEHAHTIEPIRHSEARALATASRLRRNRALVERESDGRIGYIHIDRMYQEQFDEFQRQVFDAGHGREGLVIDIRDNTGGFIADHLLTILTQPRHANTLAPGGDLGYPSYRTVYTSWDKPIVVVCNENSYSNAEVFAHAIKTLGRGQLVGVSTAGGVISTVREPVLDLGRLSIPFRGWFHPDTGEDYELNGAKPDHEVREEPAETVRGVDRQLVRAINVLAKECDQIKRRTPFRPVFRSGVMDAEETGE